MRRLTEYHPDGHVVLKDQTGHGLAAALERLAAYEDSDIFPQVAQTWSQMYDEGTLALLPAAPGSMVKYKDSNDVVRVDCVNTILKVASPTHSMSATYNKPGSMIGARMTPSSMTL